MTKITNAYDTYATTGAKNEIREDLADIIYEISPEATPGIQAVGTREVTQPNFDWLVQSLPSASGTGALEGDAISRQASTGTTRRANQCLILTRNATITGTPMASTQAGYADAMAHQMQLVVRALKTDLETVFFANTAKNTGNATTVRTTAGFSSWLTSNKVLGSAGSPAVATGDGSDTITDGTKRALTKAHINSAMQQVFGNSSQKPSILLCGPFNKGKIGAFDESSTNMRRMIDANQVGASVTVVASDFGDLEVMPDNFNRERDVFLINPEYARVAYLRNFERKPMGAIGDGVTEAVYVEAGVQVDNEATHAIIADCTDA